MTLPKIDTFIVLAILEDYLTIERAWDDYTRRNLSGEAMRISNEILRQENEDAITEQEDNKPF